MKKQTLNVSAIKNGTVIDHIPLGQGLNILKHFHLDKLGQKITVGFNLTSQQGNSKDLIKIEEVHFNEEEANHLALFAPSATINEIQDYQVIRKYQPDLPQTIQGVFSCPNSNCATHHEPIASLFSVKQGKEQVKLRCYFCEKIYPITWVMDK